MTLVALIASAVSAAEPPSKFDLICRMTRSEWRGTTANVVSKFEFTERLTFDLDRRLYWMFRGTTLDQRPFEIQNVTDQQITLFRSDVLGGSSVIDRYTGSRRSIVPVNDVWGYDDRGTCDRAPYSAPPERRF